MQYLLHSQAHGTHILYIYNIIQMVLHIDSHVNTAIYIHTFTYLYCSIYST